MRKIYLIRHAEPFLEGGEHRCFGCGSDPGLSPEGEARAARLAECFDGGDGILVYSSPLRRSRRTAQLMSAGRWEVRDLPALRELDCGEWEGLTFAQIRERYPEHYARRGEDMSLPPPGGETFDSAAARARDAITGLLRETGRDLVIVAHAGVNRALMCSLLGLPMKDNRTLRQEYACINVLVFDGERLEVTAIGRGADELASPSEMYALCGTPARVIRHCEAVRGTALALCRGLGRTGTELLENAALLHDMCRAGPDHARAAAELLRRRGCLKTARIVAAHHDCPADGGLDERKLLFLADKLTSGDRRVTLEERFGASLARCASPEAREIWRRRRDTAFAILEQYTNAAGPAALTEVFRL